MKTSIVLGTGFGDEGKGLMTDYLCSQSEYPIVVRFSGGHQAGHTVVIGNKRHVFSSFGSGTLRGAATYWSKYCTCSPIALLKERNTLVEAGISPLIYIDPLAMITTPLDRLKNRELEDKQNHGSCGVGFGTTIQRNEQYTKLFMQDLLFPTVLRAKLEAVSRYYDIGNDWIDKFMQSCKSLLDICKIRDESILQTCIIDHVIFEGSQGILLDMDFGFFPNVTRSNTTSKNAISMIKGNMENPEIYYMTRCYQTRHGNGFMSDQRELELINNEKETNIENQYQGKFKTGALDIELLRYAINSDKNFSDGFRSNLVITCLDQFKNNIFPTTETFMESHQLAKKLQYNSWYESHSPDSQNLAQCKSK